MTEAQPTGTRPLRSRIVGRMRFVASWVTAIALLALGLPRAVNVSWHGVVPVLTSIHLQSAIALVGLWLLGLYVHSFVLTAAAPSLTHRRALTLNVTGSAVSNVVPLGGAAGVELNRRMMRTWGIDARAFTGYTFLTNVWDVGAKLLLPIAGVIALTHAGEVVVPMLRTASVVAGVAFVGLVAISATLLASARCAAYVGGLLERVVRTGLRLTGRDRELDLATALLELRRECTALVASGWLRMSFGIVGYVALQCLLLGMCLHLTGGGTTGSEVLAGFAVERLITVVPITPGGVGVADLGMVGVLVALGGDPAGVAAAAVLYRMFVFAFEIPVGGGALGLWLIGQRMTGRRPPRAPTGAEIRRIAHVTDVFLPRLGGIETHVDDLVRHQRASGLRAEVLTSTRTTGSDPSWVRRMSARQARHAVIEYDAVHVHVSLLSPFAISVARAAAAAGVPTVVTAHSMWSGAGLILRPATVARLRRSRVLWSAVSEGAAATFRRPLRGAAVTVLPNAIDVEGWRPDEVELAPAHDAHPLTIISVMRLMPRKRPMQLLRMFEQVRRLAPDRDVRLVVVGDGPLQGRMERRLRRRGLARHVRITGRLARAEVRHELRAASVYAAPAPHESFGIAALEARCTGLPVVAHRRSGVAAFVRDRVDGVLVEDDAQMAVALAELVVDPGLRERITAHNRRIAPDFDWADAVARTDALYDEAARLSLAPEALPAVVPLAAGA